ncbi:hypothetical protein AU195_12465 [Mycobacterium sp. IS-1496]|uniref:hypothetical protein n=1 Tax=Mycobacterium sp. IS-1496 TaxID=1772284 RepID=UPI000741728D|nr:hypothetical protein [Mycobacterium sp. IS-1496]KUI31214.1 hypothetical protein AU195_12465 [Mycobacterium sp. IS-1496]
MNIVEGAARLVTGTANAATAAAGALGGAAVNGIVGGVQGAATGARQGLSSGSHSTPAALLTLGAVGAAGLVEWPVLAAVGGTALLARQLGQSAGTDTAPESPPPSRARKTAPARKKTVTASS